MLMTCSREGQNRSQDFIRLAHDKGAPLKRAQNMNLKIERIKGAKFYRKSEAHVPLNTALDLHVKYYLGLLYFHSEND